MSSENSRSLRGRGGGREGAGEAEPGETKRPPVIATYESHMAFLIQAPSGHHVPGKHLCLTPPLRASTGQAHGKCDWPTIAVHSPSERKLALPVYSWRDPFGQNTAAPSAFNAGCYAVLQLQPRSDARSPPHHPCGPFVPVLALIRSNL